MMPKRTLLILALLCGAFYPPAGAQTAAVNLACFSITSTSEWVVNVDAGCSTPGAQSYQWSWGDGTTTTTASTTASHAYNVRGTYTICLTADYLVTSDSTCQTTSRIGPTDQVLAEHWAPVFYQDTDTTDASADEIAAFNFDGTNNWAGNDNWDNEPLFSHRAYVYYYIMETTGHYYLGYMAFHPRDWAESGEREHENDMEGALLMIKKTSSTKGSFVAAHTMAHWNFFPYVPSGSGVSAKSTHPHGPAQTVGFWGVHVELGIEARGHGMYRKEAVYTTDFNGHGIIYYPATFGQVPLSSNDRDVKYGLLSIDPLWDRRFDYGGSNPYQSYGIFNGDTSGSCGDFLIPCDIDQARPPWGMYDEDESGTVGIWWTDPAQYYKDHMNGLGTVSTTYVYKSYD